MLFRVRNTKCKELDIYHKQNYAGYNPLNIKDIEEYVKDKDQLILNCGLKIDYIRGNIIKDTYRWLKINKSNLIKYF